MKKIIIWIIALVTGLYSTFVAQCFWNWFAVLVLPVPPVFFWQMFGIILLINLFSEKDDSIEKSRWEVVYKLLEACLPESKKQEIEEFVNEKEKNAWVDAGSKVFEKFFSNTITLAFGFIIHAIFF